MNPIECIALIDPVFIECIVSLHAHFNDCKKVFRWLATINPLLGDVTPLDMVRMGRVKKLLKFITACLDENGEI